MYTYINTDKYMCKKIHIHTHIYTKHRVYPKIQLKKIQECIRLFPRFHVANKTFFYSVPTKGRLFEITTGLWSNLLCSDAISNARTLVHEHICILYVYNNLKKSVQIYVDMYKDMYIRT